MAQTGFTPIQLYSTSTAAAAPSAGNLTNSTLGSELAINITDGKLFYKDNANAVQVIGWKTVPTTAGGTGLTSYTAGDMLFYASGTALSQLAIGASGRYMSSTGSAPQWSAPAALTKTDDTNVTLTLGGSASTALLNAASLTLGWTGTLAVSRGGTGTGTAFTTGSVIFAGASGVYSQDNAQLFWDDTNNRLGIGTTTPPHTLSVNGDIFLTYGQAIRSATEATPAHNVIVQNYYDANGNDTLLLKPAGASGGGQIIFAGRTGTERARIFGSGGVSIGNTNDPGAGVLNVTNGIYLNTSSAIDSGRVSVLFSTATNNGISLRTSSSTTTYNLMSFLNASSTSVGFIYTNGTGTTYGTTSDYRLKDNIQPMTGALEKIAQLRPVTYTWKMDGSEGQGFIAHELQAVVPDCVTGKKDGTRIERYEITPAVPATLDEDGRIIKEAVEAVMGEREAPSYQGVDTSFLVATLTAAIQEQQKQISAFDDRIKFLEKQNAAN